MWRVVLLSAVVVWASMIVFSSATSTPDMIVIMMDGFRWDYPVIHAGDGLPGLDRFATSGVRAKYLNPVFPANTFPNWHTMATGLYPENHGIVNNYIHDPERKIEFSQDRDDLMSDPVWWGEAEPLWITATKNQVDTALILWARCDVPWEGRILPRYCKPYEVSAPDTINNFRVNLGRALDMIQYEGYKLVMLYVWAVDTLGHLHGPLSPEVASIVRDVDRALQGLWQDLETRDLINTTNVVVVSDHGMTGTAPRDKVTVEVGDCLQKDQILYVTEFGGFTNIVADQGYCHKVVESVRSCPGVGDKVVVYKKEDLPERYHYKTHRLISHVIVIAKPGYSISVTGIQKKLPEKEPQYEGGHGFDNTEGQNPDMRGILFAHGPSFASGVEVGEVEQVDVYGLVCRGLHLSCHPNNGSRERVDAFFTSHHQTQQEAAPLPLSLILLAMFTVMVAVVLLYSVGGGGSGSV